MGYTLEYTGRADDDMSRLDRRVAELARRRLLWLAGNAEAVDHHELTGQWSGYCRLRISDYRAIYRLEHDERRVIVERVRHRSVAYRRR